MGSENLSVFSGDKQNKIPHRRYRNMQVWFARVLGRDGCTWGWGEGGRREYLSDQRKPEDFRRGQSTKEEKRDFPGTPVVKTPRFHCRGHGFDPWSGN